MAIHPVADGLHIIPGLVNIYVLQTDDGLALIDTGFPGSAKKVLAALQAIDRAPADVRHILLTHAHPDHIGGAADIQRATGAAVWAHGIDAPIIEAGRGFRSGTASPGLRNRMLTPILLRTVREVGPTKVDHLLADGDALPFLPDLHAVHVPGHCAGQIAFFWKRSGGILFTADACINRRGLKLPVAHEDIAEGRRSLARLAMLTFEIACFGHGPPIMERADARFRERWLDA